MDDYIKREDAIKAVKIALCKESALTRINNIPLADVRENVKAEKVIGGGEHDGATCWFECSSCHGSVDIEDAYCKHCGAVLEIGEMKDE